LVDHDWAHPDDSSRQRALPAIAGGKSVAPALQSVNVASQDLPVHWPSSLSPERLAGLGLETPFLACDLETVADRLGTLRKALPGVDVHYAVKCNPLPEIITSLLAQGAGFEVASYGELDLLVRNGVRGQDVLFSNTIKPAKHIAQAVQAGVWRFAFDSENELHKIATHAPGSAVYVRLRVDDSTSRFPLGRKFGAEAHTARALMLLARALGLVPYGLTFHVGSQCTTPGAWRSALAGASRLMRRLDADGITLRMIDLGGGFPARYVDPLPPIEQYGRTIMAALDGVLPYRPETIIAEPGRYLVAESAVMVSSVLGREERAGEEWLYLDVGVYNGLMETQQTLNEWEYPLWTSRAEHATAQRIPFTVAGPSCDSADTMFLATPLPASLGVGDLVMIGSAGAYTLSYASHFNGFPPPTPVFL
jgi:ornithine decarboxylase